MIKYISHACLASLSLSTRDPQRIPSRLESRAAAYRVALCRWRGHARLWASAAAVFFAHVKVVNRGGFAANAPANANAVHDVLRGALANNAELGGRRAHQHAQDLDFGHNELFGHGATREGGGSRAE